MDKKLITRRFTKALPTYETEAKVQNYAAEQLMNALESINFGSCGAAGGKCDAVPSFARALEIGCGTGFLSRMLLQKCVCKELWLNDMCDVESYISDLLSDSVHFIHADAETADFPQDLDLIISSSSIQWMEDLPSFLDKCAKALRPGGIIALSTFGTDNLKEIREITGRGLEYYSLEELERMLCGKEMKNLTSRSETKIPPIGGASEEKKIINDRERMKILISEEETRALTFTSPTEILRHFKQTGVSGIGTNSWNRAAFSHFDAQYREKFSCPGGVRLTFTLFRLIASK